MHLSKKRYLLSESGDIMMRSTSRHWHYNIQVVWPNNRADMRRTALKPHCSKPVRKLSSINRPIQLLYMLWCLVGLQADAEVQDTAILKTITPEAVASRIRSYRMGDIIVKAKPGTSVKVEQVRHEFLFGTAIPDNLAENSENPMTDTERKTYLKILKENFNYAVHENAIKWYATEKQPGIVDYSVGDRIWKLLDNEGIPMRGHCIYWAKDEFLMDWLKGLDNDSLRLAVKNRGVSLVSHYKGRIDEFDLNNEMIHGNFFSRRLGFGIISEMAWIAKATNPKVKLFMNDYGIVDVGYNAGPYAEQIRQLLANGVPIDGIGIQAHRSIKGELHNTPYLVQRNLERFTQFNLPIKITEALFVYDDEKRQAEELKTLFPIYFAHPRVEAIVLWGIWEKVHWTPEAAMWRSDFSPTAQAKAYRELVYGTWWTKTEQKTNRYGEARIHAFYGDYVVTVNGIRREITLSKSTGVVETIF